MQVVDKSIEEFMGKHVAFPKANRLQILRNLDLKERIVNKDTKHIRAFASEVLLLIVGLAEDSDPLARLLNR